MFRAARFGVRGELPDAHGPRRAVSEILKDVLARVESRARELECEEIALLPELVRRGGGAGAQRATHEIAGIDAVTRRLAELTATEATSFGR